MLGSWKSLFTGAILGSFFAPVLSFQTAPPLWALNQTYQSPRSDYWNGWGGNIYNNRWNPNDTAIDIARVTSLQRSCSIEYDGGVSATPTVDGDVVYYPTYSGQLVALNYKNCNVIWSYNVTKLINDFGNQTHWQRKLLIQGSRTSPVVHEDVIYFGTEAFALLVALDRNTGKHIAHTQINPHPLAIDTMSPTYYNGYIFVGTSSREEPAARKIPGYKCCSFVGNFAAFRLDKSAQNFNVHWNITTLPTSGNWSGGGVWGSQPSIDPMRDQVFIATGNVYSFPDAYKNCRQAWATVTLPSKDFGAHPCVPRGVYEETILSIDIQSGFINWDRKVSPLDAWEAACGWGGSIQDYTQGGRNYTLCPFKPGKDADFGMAPTFIPGSHKNNTPHGMDTLVVGEKNGDLWALEAATGRTFWVTKTCPDGNLGGLSFGIAVDNRAVYYTAMNSDYRNWTIPTSGKGLNSSAFGAVSLHNGSILWETPSPGGAFAFSPPTVVNDVVLFAREDSTATRSGYYNTTGALIPINKRTGKILKQYPLDTIMHGGISVVDRFIFFGTGYHSRYKGNGTFYVWTTPSPPNGTHGNNGTCVI